MGRSPHTVKPPFGEHLMQLRMREGLTLAQVSELTGIATSSIGAFELRGTISKPEFIEKLAKAYNVSVEELLNIKPANVNGFMTRGKLGALEQSFMKARQLPVGKQKLLREVIDSFTESNLPKAS